MIFHLPIYMNSFNFASMKILREVLSLPTAPFHEGTVMCYVIQHTARLGLKVSADKYGNIIVRYRRGTPRQPVIFTAHMDHPGFEVLSVAGCACRVGHGFMRCRVGILGGIKPEYFAGARVVIKTFDGYVNGKVARRPLKEKWQGKNVFEVWVDVKRGAVDVGDFGWYDIAPVRIKGDIIYTKAADNLVGTAVLLDLLSALARKRAIADVRCVFTRAEEVGFAGCIALSREGLIPKNVPTIVLECSSAAAGKVDIGGGPVIRVGDKLSCFSSEIDCWLKSIAEKLAGKNRKFRYQRALLGGGTCEASVWTLANHPVSGLAFSLGNYHNNGPKSYAPEFVSAKDYLWMQEFLLAIASAGKYGQAFKDAEGKIIENYKKWEKLWTSL